MVTFTLAPDSQVTFTSSRDYVEVLAATCGGTIDLTIGGSLSDDDPEAEEDAWFRNRIERAYAEGGEPLPYSEYRKQRFGR